MEYEVDFYEFRQKIKHLFERQIFGLFFLRQKEASKIMKNHLGLKYLSYCDVGHHFIVKFEVIDKNKFFWAKIAYGI